MYSRVINHNSPVVAVQPKTKIFLIIKPALPNPKDVVATTACKQSVTLNCLMKFVLFQEIMGGSYKSRFASNSNHQLVHICNLF